MGTSAPPCAPPGGTPGPNLMLESGLSSARGVGCCSHRFPWTCVGAGPRLPPPGGPGAPTACTGAQKQHCAYIRRWPPREDNGQAGLSAEPAEPHGVNAPAGAPCCPQEVTERWAHLPLRGLSLHSRRGLGDSPAGTVSSPNAVLCDQGCSTPGHKHSRETVKTQGAVRPSQAERVSPRSVQMGPPPTSPHLSRLTPCRMLRWVSCVSGLSLASDRAGRLRGDDEAGPWRVEVASGSAEQLRELG